MFTGATQRRSSWEKVKETGNPSSTKSTTKNKNLFPEMEERNTACARLYHLIFGKNKLVIIAITLEEQVNKSREIGLHDQNRPYQIKKTIERTVLEYRRKRAVDGRIHAYEIF